MTTFVTFKLSRVTEKYSVSQALTKLNNSLAFKFLTKINSCRALQMKRTKLLELVSVHIMYSK